MNRIVFVLIIAFSYGAAVSHEPRLYEPRSATVEESVLRGKAALARGNGQYLESLGLYENLHAEAARKTAENWVEAVRIRNEIKDEWKARHQKDGVSIAQRRLDNVERMAALKKREEELQRAGLISKAPARLTWNGQTFSSWEQFKSSPSYASFIAERDQRAEEEAAKAHHAQVLYDQAIERLRNAGKLTPAEKEEMLRQPTLREIMGEKWWQDYQKYHPQADF